ncbi:unnamed protein product [Clavelina lepadiformis]|uniref:Yippee domain-containing protein n=1 Tax=Clavelina lepadiformis TaxID=159417 RepID=A0ABP0GQD6_CLALP
MFMTSYNHVSRGPLAAWIKTSPMGYTYYDATLIRMKKERAYDTSQKYKEGKFIIELIHMIKDNGWS